ncbi:OsmC family protein [Dyella jiangningensis]|uniref:Osmotically inducible protein C n=1 Tax=Dyella jiangningensis TaxID=1379159 RepID=A0A328PEM7_9GAMM|nr:OsmC family protein [Dyella jiangningensis]RAO78124.1 osmotically inducible protein C [Dyella jiangningensis]
MPRVSSATIVSTDSNYLHHIHAGHYAMDTDEPLKLGGQGAAPAPFDYYLASLAACTAITLRMYAQRKGWDLGEFRAELEMQRDDDGKLHVHRTLHATGPLTDEQWQRLLEIVANTPVTKAMREGVDITSARAGADATN